MHNQRIYIDNYEILRTLGQGFCGEVRLGRDVNSNQLVALKILDKNLKNSQQIEGSILNEGNYLQKIQHPNIIKLIRLSNQGVVKINDKVLSSNNLYMCLELAPNKEIFDIISETGKFDENLTRWYAKQLLDVLDFLHGENFVHRDLKPENILLGENFEIKLIDFGFSKFIEEGQLNQSNLGTPGYRAPEIIERKKYDAKKADIFALGVILFIFIKGSPPFKTANLNKDPYYKTLIYKPDKYWSVMDQDKSVSKELRNLLQGCLNQNYEERLSIKEILKSEFMQQPIDEESAKQQMTQRLQQIEEAHKMKIENVEDEDDENNYRSRQEDDLDELDNYYVSQETLDKIAIRKNAEGCRLNVTVDCNDKQKVVNKILQTLEDLRDWDITNDFDERHRNIEIEFQKDQDQLKWSIELVQVSQTQLGFSIIFKEGNYFDNQNMKKNFIQNFKKKCCQQNIQE